MIDQRRGLKSTADSSLNWMLSVERLNNTLQYLPGRWIERDSAAQTDGSLRRVVVALDGDAALYPQSPIRSQVTEIVAKRLTMVNHCRPRIINACHAMRTVTHTSRLDAERCWL